MADEHQSTASARWVRVVFNADEASGLQLQDGRVVNAGPTLARLIGEAESYARAWCKLRGWTVEECNG